VARGISGIILKNTRASCKCVDCGLIVEKGRGLNEKWLEYLIFELFLIENGDGPGPELGGPRVAAVHGGPRIGPRRWLTGSRPER
jgi:hypothetical protein